jgi:hypothetical protein
MSVVLAIVVVITALIAVMGVIGSRMNIRLARQFAGILESVFQPVEKNYTNIGGVVGYHFRYDTGPLLGAVEGTMTFLPRQTILYLPFSLLAGRQDRLSIVMHLEASPPGQGHVVEAGQLKNGWFPIEDEENMSRTLIKQSGKDFIILWYNPLVRDRLSDALGKIPDASSLRHFAYNGIDHTFLVELQPNPESLSKTLQFFISFIPEFSSKSL